MSCRARHAKARAAGRPSLALVFIIAAALGLFAASLTGLTLALSGVNAAAALPVIGGAGLTGAALFLFVTALSFCAAH